jgi:hypothetical protein
MKDNNTSQVYLPRDRRKGEWEIVKNSLLSCTAALFCFFQAEMNIKLLIIRNELFTIKYFSLAGD